MLPDLQVSPQSRNVFSASRAASMNRPVEAEVKPMRAASRTEPEPTEEAPKRADFCRFRAGTGQ
jgi:hypothetical protein